MTNHQLKEYCEAEFENVGIVISELFTVVKPQKRKYRRTGSNRYVLAKLLYRRRLELTPFALARNGQSPHTSCRGRVGRFITNHDGPGPDFPSGHQPPDNIGVAFGEVFGDRALGRAKHEECSVCRVGERPSQEQLATAVRLPQEPEMFLPVRGPARHEIVDHIVE